MARFDVRTLPQLNSKSPSTLADTHERRTELDDAISDGTRLVKEARAVLNYGKKKSRVKANKNWRKIKDLLELWAKTEKDFEQGKANASSRKAVLSALTRARASVDPHEFGTVEMMLATQRRLSLLRGRLDALEKQEAALVEEKTAEAGENGASISRNGQSRLRTPPKPFRNFAFMTHC